MIDTLHIRVQNISTAMPPRHQPINKCTCLCVDFTYCISLLQKKILTATFENDLGGGHHFEPPWLMHTIYQGGHFLLTEAVTETTSVNRLTEAIMCNVTASVNRGIFRGGHV